MASGLLLKWLVPEKKKKHALRAICCSYHTWTQGGASYFLNVLPLAEGPPIEWGRVSASPCALLEASPTAAVAHRPLSPGRPASIHWKARGRVWHCTKAILEITSTAPLSWIYPSSTNTETFSCFQQEELEVMISLSFFSRSWFWGVRATPLTPV